MKEQSQIKGNITHIVYHNTDTGYLVAVFSVSGENREETVVGTMPEPREGLTYTLTGAPSIHERYGEQFAFTSYEEELPETQEGVEAFLSSGAVKGIGPKAARAIVRRFGGDTLRIIAEEPDRLMEIPGIGQVKAAQISEAYLSHREFADVSIALRAYGIGARGAMKLYEIFGPDAPSAVEEDPYQLVGTVAGIGFRRADAIAMKVGISPDDPHRIRAFLLYSLNWYAGEGNTFVGRRKLEESTAQTLELSVEQVSDQLVSLAFDGSVKIDRVDGREVVYPLYLYTAERYVAHKLASMCRSEVSPIDGEVDSVIGLTQRDLNIRFSDEQKQAIRACMEHSVCVITGGPGTGKTTIINGIIRILTENGMDCAIAAPTGRAAKRITQATGYSAGTIHRLLEYYYDEASDEMRFGKDENDPLTYDAVIIDEASMVDLVLMQGLLKALRPGTRLVIVGDADQLPSVGAGNVLRDIIASDVVFSVHLKDIFRQAAESLIVVNAHRINRGEYPSVNERDGDFFFMRRDHENEMLETIIELCRDRLPARYGLPEGAQSIQVIAPAKKGLVGTINLNRELQKALNPPAPDKAEKTFGRRIFREGDKVMQIRNDYQLSWRSLEEGEGTGVFNGDVGIVNSIDDEEGDLLVVYSDDRWVRYEFKDVEELELAYAVTVHKAQGSEFPMVVMPMTYVPPMLATRNLLYTAVTRAKDLAVLVGSPRQMCAMVDNNETACRESALAERLQQEWL